MSMVQQAIEVSAPLHAVYEQLAAFETYPQFMTGVERVVPTGHQQAHWVMDLDGTRREFDAQITELAYDQRVAWASVAGPRLAETLTLRPLGETRTQVVAQLEADVAALMPADHHGEETLNRRLKDDLTAFKGLIENGAARKPAAGASTKQLAGRSGTLFGGSRKYDPASPASVAARIRNRPARPLIDDPDLGNHVDITSAPGITDVHDLDDVLAPGRRIVTHGPVRGTAAGAAPMGGHTPASDGWGDGMINEEDRGSAGR
jgi:ribosome-associated toxin RatA of RatAB toxin-antitoxin module